LEILFNFTMGVFPIRDRILSAGLLMIFYNLILEIPAQFSDHISIALFLYKGYISLLLLSILGYPTLTP
jgi:hypothetical protein